MRYAQYFVRIFWVTGMFSSKAGVGGLIAINRVRRKKANTIVSFSTLIK